MTSCESINYCFLTQPSTTDLAQVIQIYREQGWWFADREAPEIAEGIIRGSHCFAVAREGERIIGMGRAISDRISDAYLQDLAVLHPFRDAGIGGQLVRRIVQQLRADGIDWIGLIAERCSHPFYERLGFFQIRDARPMRLDPNHEV